MTRSTNWLEEVPEDWAVVPAKALFFERREPSGSDDVHLTPSQSHGVLPQLEYMRVTGNRVVLNLESPENMKHVEPDDFIIHLRSFQGGIEHSRRCGKVSVAYTVLAPHRAADPRFFRWALKCGGYIQELRVTTNQLRDGQSIKFGQFASVPLPKPPIDQQAAIADYLDRETARIDTIIEKQEKLIETLRERRAGFASEALRDLDQDRIKLKYLFRVSKRQGFPDEPVLSVYRDYGVILKSSRSDNANQTPIDLSNYQLVQEHDLVVNRMKAWQGSLGVSQLRGIVSSDYEVARPTDNRFLPNFIHLYLRSPHMKHEYRMRSTGIRPSQWRLYWDQLGEVRIPMVPPEEQTRICHKVTTVTAKIDNLIDKAQVFIGLASERREALITAAVTGQIRIRKEAVRG